MKHGKKKPFGAVLGFLVLFAAGWCGGLFIDGAVAPYLDALSSPGLVLIWAGVLLAALALLVYLQIAIHEAGHLLGGLATGYRFSSYRIGSLMLLRTQGKLTWRRISVAGTGGQCLMVPPPLVEGKIPYVLYNLGGALANLAAAGGFVLLWLAFRENLWLAPISLIGVFVGLLFALTNGIPMRVGMIDNDGRNALSLGRHPDALRAFWVQMQVNAAQSEGVRLREMPDAWFSTEGLDLHNAMTAALAVFACNRLMDEHRFAEADARMDTLLAGNGAVVGLYRSLLTCDRIWCALMADAPERAAALNTPELERFMRSMKDFPSVIRTAHALALLGKGDAEAAAALTKRFAGLASRYPYPSDLASEGELMALAREKYDAAH